MLRRRYEMIYVKFKLVYISTATDVPFIAPVIIKQALYSRHSSFNERRSYKLGRR